MDKEYIIKDIEKKMKHFRSKRKTGKFYKIMFGIMCIVSAFISGFSFINGFLGYYTTGIILLFLSLVFYFLTSDQMVKYSYLIKLYNRVEEICKNWVKENKLNTELYKHPNYDKTTEKAVNLLYDEYKIR